MSMVALFKFLLCSLLEARACIGVVVRTMTHALFSQLLLADNQSLELLYDSPNPALVVKGCQVYL